MVARGASDLHLSAGNAPQIRKDGEMQPLERGIAPLSTEEVVQLLAPIVPGKNRLQFEKYHDSDFAYEIEGVGRFRGNIFLDRKGMGAVFRRVPTTILTADQLELSPSILKLCALKKGLVLVTGPTGSGKSTTLAAMIDHINRTRTDHIVTIEDPIEFVHENKRCLINQREVHTHTRSFKAALRAALREDPDVVLIGEMRDLETVAIALQTAETGHLVFGTLHTTTAASTIDRIIDQFPASNQAQIRVMLADALKGVIAQTLCRRVGGGRVAGLEILIVTSAISNLIRSGKTHQIPTMMQVSRGAGMVTLGDALADLVKAGKITPEEAQLHTPDQAEEFIKG
jgi:twitching motility protein PilT